MNIYTHSKIKRTRCLRGSAGVEIEGKRTTDVQMQKTF